MKWSSLNTIFLRRDRFNNSSSVFPCSLFSFKQKHKTLKWKRSKISNFQQQQQTLNKNKNNAKATPVFPLLLTFLKCVFLVQILNSLETDKTLNEFRFKIRISNKNYFYELIIKYLMSFLRNLFIKFEHKLYSILIKYFQ